jgi:hypothetical protein
MSLTSHLKDASSPVRGWLDARFSDLGQALKTLRAGMPLPDVVVLAGEEGFEPSIP